MSDLVENFRRQYITLFPHRKELFLCPLNEDNERKFASTFIRPTKLEHKELYDYHSCANWVANYITYVPLDPSFELPDTLQSPATTLLRQRGNCFDMSVLLCSLLRGVGFNAFVVSGYASRRITLMDESDVEVDVQKLKQEHGFLSLIPEFKTNLKTWECKYKPKPRIVLESKYEKRMQTRTKPIVKEQKLETKQDLMEGLRVHAWLLCLPGRRDVAEPFFIEPSTGKVFDVESKCFLGVESVFSSTNYWVNMQKCMNGLLGISFDLSDHQMWEFVYPKNTHPTMFDQEEDEEMENEVPTSWTKSVEITKEQLESHSGQKTMSWKNAKLEIYPPYLKQDGLCARLHCFSKIYERYRNRKDKLWKRTRSDVIHEYFEQGRSNSLAEHIYQDGKTILLRFFKNARSDGLYERKEESNLIVELYAEREDRLCRRKIQFEDQEEANIIKITEHYSKRLNSSMFSPGDETLRVHHNEIKKLVFNLRDEYIKIWYHIPNGCLVSSWREFKKTSDQKKSFLELTSAFEPHPIKKFKKQHLFSRLCDLLKIEQNCLNNVGQTDREIKALLHLRQEEEQQVVLLISMFDTIRNKTDIAREMEKETQKQQEEASKEAQIDYLSPYIVRVLQEDRETFSKEEALQIRDLCLKTSKERLQQRQMFIQKRYEEETSSYQQKQQYFSSNSEQMTQEETQEYVLFCNESLFRINVLESRLVKHKEQAPEIISKLEKKIALDPRFN